MPACLAFEVYDSVKATNTVAVVLAGEFPGLTCPITGELMTDPAILVGTGMSYERSAIVAHLARHGTDPN
jgi:hypothetical protein